MRFRCMGGVMAACVFTVLTGGVARANLLVNGGMESAILPTIPPNLVYVAPAYNSTALTGWTITSGTIDIVPNSYWQAAEGSYSVDMVGTPGAGSIQQLVSNLTTRANYTLTFSMSANPEKPFYVDETGTTKILQVTALGANGTTILNQQTFSLANGTRTFADMQYVPQIFGFTTDGTAATIVLTALTPGGLPLGSTSASIYTGPVVDKLDLEAGGAGGPAVPEPASLSALGIGSMLLLLRRRTRVG